MRELKIGDFLELPGRKKPVKVVNIGEFSIDFETERGKKGALIKNIYGPIYMNFGTKTRRIK